MEKFSKIKRGRKENPAKKTFEDLYHDKGARSVNNRISFAIALRACGWNIGKEKEPDYPYAWLFEHSAGGNFKRMTLISELGRFDDEETIRVLAAGCCESKPPVKMAIARLRNYRLTGNMTTPGDVFNLYMALLRCLDDYSAAHELSNNDILEALNRVSKEYLVD